MNKLFSFLLGAIILLGLTQALSSCDSDNGIDPLAIKSINVDYSVTLNQLTFDFYDVEVRYRNERGEAITFNLTEPKIWAYSFSLPPEKAPRDYAFIVTLTPKKDHPEIESGQRYVFEKDIKCEFYSLRNNGEIFRELSSDLHPVNISASGDDTYSSDNLWTAMTSGHTRHLVDFHVQWDGKY